MANTDDDLPTGESSSSKDPTITLKEIEEKTYGRDKNQQTWPVITGFDSARFIQYFQQRISEL